VTIRALAEDVFDTEAALARAGGHAESHPFGELVSNPAYPHIAMVNALLGVRATDCPIGQLEPFLKVATIDPAVRAALDPRLGAVGFRPEHKLAMMQVADSIVSANPVISVERVDGPRWADYDQLIRESAAEEPRPWLAAVVEEWIALKHWQAAHLPMEWYVAYHAGRPVARIGLFQHGHTGRLQNVFVRRQERGRGVGGSMLLAMTERSRQLGCDRLTLMCGLETTLPQLYRRFGFRPVGEWYAWVKPITR
jgi:GNAT superfamily N-acetyltransferase